MAGWETDDGRIDLEPGYMYLIPPYTKVNLRTRKRIEKFYFHFSLRYANSEILEGIESLLPPAVVTRQAKLDSQHVPEWPVAGSVSAQGYCL